MLTEIHIENFALIKEAYVEFDKGLNIFTGETGAGKTLVVTAMNMLLGDRADKAFVRTECERASIEGLFSLDPDKRPAHLKERVPGENDDIVFTRELLDEGKSKCYVNGKIVTVRELSQISEGFVDLHGQHEHQSLLKTQIQLDYLDAFGGNELLRLRSEFAQTNKTLNDKKRKLEDLVDQQDAAVKKQELLKFQINEIESANLSIGEEKELKNRKQILSHSEKLHQAAGNCLNLISGEGANELNASDLLREAVSALDDVKGIDSKLDGICESMESVVYTVEDCARATREYSEEVEFDPSQLTEVEERLNCVSMLRKKYGDSIEEILEFKERAQTELNLVEHRDKDIASLKSEIDELERTLIALALQLSTARKEIAKSFQNEVKNCLSDLDMPRARFEVAVRQQQDETGLMVEKRLVKVFTDGIDKVMFLISPNPGEPLRPLHKSASGGELSRVMLALKIVLTNIDHITTLIFDEIDAGVGGKTAFIIGQKLAQLTRNHQVVCITHLPQIACFADKHFYIGKKEKGGRTVASVKVLDSEGCLNEISRMLSGGVVSELSKKHAAETINEAATIKKKMRKEWYAAV